MCLPASGKGTQSWVETLRAWHVNGTRAISSKIVARAKMKFILGNSPQGLKPEFFLDLNGTAEAVPLPSNSSIAFDCRRGRCALRSAETKNMGICFPKKEAVAGDSRLRRHGTTHRGTAPASVRDATIYLVKDLTATASIRRSAFVE